MWTEDYKRALMHMMSDKQSTRGVDYFTEHHTDGGVLFKVKVDADFLDKLQEGGVLNMNGGLRRSIGAEGAAGEEGDGEGDEDEDGDDEGDDKGDEDGDSGDGGGGRADGWEGSDDEVLSDDTMRFFRLKRRIFANNMHCWDPEYRSIVRYDDEAHIMDSFYPVRLDLYERRKAEMIRTLKVDVAAIDNSIGFIEHVIDGRLVIMGRPQADIVNDAKALGLQSVKKLLSMKVLNLTTESVTRLEHEHARVKAQLDDLQRTPTRDIWRTELLELREMLVAECGEPAVEVV
jgi:hypothetical protein